MTTLEEFKEAAPGYVAAGAEWLDLNEPGWEGRIDLADLDLSNSCRCVLGQLAPEQSYSNALARLFNCNWDELNPSCPVGEKALAWAIKHGFNKPMGTEFDFYAVLDELWIALVKERYNSGTLSE